MPVETSEYWRLMHERDLLHLTLLDLFNYSRHHHDCAAYAHERGGQFKPCDCGLKKIHEVVDNLQYKLPQGDEIG